MKQNLSKTSWKFGWGRIFGKCSKLAREAPRAIQKIQKNIGPKRALGPNLSPWALFALGPWWPYFHCLGSMPGSFAAKGVLVRCDTFNCGHMGDR